MYRPRIAITPGEPAGIGPDLVLQLSQQSDLNADLVIVADPDLMRRRALLMGVVYPEEIKVKPVRLNKIERPGYLDSANAAYVLETIQTAVKGCLEGEFDALVTGPVQKSVINEAGVHFTGHTEFIADLCHVSQPVMMLVTSGLRVALVTTHIPLKEVSAAITSQSLYDVLSILYKDLVRHFALPEPRIYVCGLNPHAGENGYLGTEEQDVIRPVIERCKSEGMGVTGPLPADTIFIKKHLQQADAVLAMYHDQGLPVIKSVGFGHSVNVTLGLPIIRTSVDHGTALDLVGTNKADSTSLIAALTLANEMITNR